MQGILDIDDGSYLYRRNFFFTPFSPLSFRFLAPSRPNVYNLLTATKALPPF